MASHNALLISSGEIWSTSTYMQTAAVTNVLKLAVLTQFWFWKCRSAMGPSLPRSHSAVVCGGWHLALRLSCLPPPLFSALQWDHVVLLISQQWPYSLPFPLFSLSTFPHSSCLRLLPSRRHIRQTICNFSPAVTSTLFTLLGAFFFFFLTFFSSTRSFSTSPPTHPALWSLGCRLPVLQVSPEHQSTLSQPQLLLKNGGTF